MKKVVFFIAFTMMYCSKPTVNKSVVYGLVIHGGAGTITKKNMSLEKESAYRDKLTEALAAGTSTGGLTNKRWGRIGDTPIVGAGNYANNQTCGVSGTGQGEYFIRGNMAFDVSALMNYSSLSVEQAARQVIGKLSGRGGRGGLIAMDKNGNIAMPFNTEGMYRGYYLNGSEPIIKIYND